MKCLVDMGRPSSEIFTVEYFDDGIAFIECSVGHKTALIMQSQKFEMLLESGAIALLDGYTLEACMTFAAALERFYEFALRVAFCSRKMPEGLFEKMFAGMARQSERQLGAFMLLHALDFETTYDMMNISEFRNSVIHKGAIPNTGKAYDFCSKVYGIIHRISGPIGEKHPESINIVVRDYLTKQHALIPNRYMTSTCSYGALFKLANKYNPPSLDEALSYLKASRQF